MKIVQHGICIKILLYTGCLADKVVYYRYNMPMRVVEKWKWYFEYLAALIKVNNPHNKVELIICAQEQTLCGEDYVREKVKNLLRARKAKLKKVRNGHIEDDLFGLTAEEKASTEQSILDEIESLERGEYRGYIPATYINDVKQYLNQSE